MTAAFTPVLSALGQATRWRAFELLIGKGDAGMLQHEIASALGIPKNLLSVHLKVLHTAGLVTAERNGREVTYRVVPDQARAAAEAMLSIIAGGRSAKA